MGRKAWRGLFFDLENFASAASKKQVKMDADRAEDHLGSSKLVYWHDFSFRESLEGQFASSTI